MYDVKPWFFPSNIGIGHWAILQTLSEGFVVRTYGLQSRYLPDVVSLLLRIRSDSAETKTLLETQDGLLSYTVPRGFPQSWCKTSCPMRLKVCFFFWLALTLILYQPPSTHAGHAGIVHCKFNHRRFEYNNR